MELTTVWFVLIAVLWTGYFCLEGFDFGVGMLFPVLGRRTATETAEERRRVLLNTIGPVWDGNEVWLITAVGATFAAFPPWYSTMLSGFYLPLLLVLVALILRALGFEYRHKHNDDRWRRRWDLAVVAGSVVPAFVWGTLFTHLVQGLPIDADGELAGSPLTLLDPVALLGGVAACALFLLHGALFVALKTDGAIRTDARALATRVGTGAGGLLVLLLVLLGLHRGTAAGWIASTAAALCLLVALRCNAAGREGRAFAGTFLAVGLTVAALFLSLFPDVMPSSTDPAWSLTTDSAASSPSTLGVLTWVAGFFTPVVIGYQAFTYWTFRRRVSTHHIPPATDERDWAPPGARRADR